MFGAAALIRVSVPKRRPSSLLDVDVVIGTDPLTVYGLVVMLLISAVTTMIVVLVVLGSSDFVEVFDVDVDVEAVAVVSSCLSVVVGVTVPEVGDGDRVAVASS